MSKLIDSNIMKGAVEKLFNHELERIGKVSSHSQLERMIIKELNDSYNPSNTVLALTLCLRELRGIELNMGDVEDDVAILSARYAGYGMYVEGIGGGRAFKQEATDGHYVLVTEEQGDDIPASLHEPVQFYLYAKDGEILYHTEFMNSITMFENKIVTYMLSR